MTLFSRRKGRAGGQAPASTAAHPPTPAERHPITYVVVRVGDHWFANICANREEALAIQQGLGDDGRYAFAGEAPAVESAHWQLREALRVYWGARGPMPWTGLPQTDRGLGMNPQLLRSSFAHALNNDHEIITHVYERLFADHPELRTYFPPDMSEQERALSEQLAEIVLHLEDPDHLRMHLSGLGTPDTEEYRRKPELYVYVKEALIRTLADAVTDWDEDLERQWDGALTAVAEMMRGGAEHAA